MIRCVQEQRNAAVLEQQGDIWLTGAAFSRSRVCASPCRQALRPAEQQGPTVNSSNTPWFQGQHLQAWRQVSLLEEPEPLPLAGLVQVAELLQ